MTSSDRASRLVLFVSLGVALPIGFVGLVIEGGGTHDYLAIAAGAVLLLGALIAGLLSVRQQRRGRYRAGWALLWLTAAFAAAFFLDIPISHGR